MLCEKNTFDFVLMGWCLAYSDNKKKALEEAIRVTRHGGSIAIGLSYSPKSNEEIINNRGYLIGSEERIRSLNDLVNLFEKGSIDKIQYGMDIPNDKKHIPGQIVGGFRVYK